MTRSLHRILIAAIGLAGLVPSPSAAVAAEQPQVATKPAYLSLGDFTTNLAGGEDQLSYVVIGITIEAAPSAASELKSMEPRLKEAIMRRLLTLADRNMLRPGHTDPMAVKSALLDAISGLMPGKIDEVLITRLLYG